mgnify:CR=1 FL=1
MGVVDAGSAVRNPVQPGNPSRDTRSRVRSRLRWNDDMRQGLTLESPGAEAR